MSYSYYTHNGLKKEDTIYMQIETNGFRVYYSSGSNDNGAKTNVPDREYHFIAIR